MQRFMLCFVFVALSALLIFTCSVDNPTAPTISQAPEISQSDQVTAPLAKKPAPNLIGTMDLDYVPLADWPEEPVWVGTITFEVEGVCVYGMKFYHLSPFKGYSQASPFEEYFEIYDLGNGTVVLGGPDVGVTTLANKPPELCKYRMNGKIEEAAEPFIEWLGRNVHMSGTIYWHTIETPPYIEPTTAPGTFRIN